MGDISPSLRQTWCASKRSAPTRSSLHQHWNNTSEWPLEATQNHTLECVFALQALAACAAGAGGGGRVASILHPPRHTPYFVPRGGRLICPKTRAPFGIWVGPEGTKPPAPPPGRLTAQRTQIWAPPAARKIPNKGSRLGYSEKGKLRATVCAGC